MENNKIKIGYIYHIINCIDDKIYVGRTFNPRNRWLQHLRDAKKSHSKLYKHMRQIGIENFTMVIISKHEMLDDIYSDCKIETFELYEIRRIQINRLLNTHNVQYYPNVLMLARQERT